MKRKKTLEGLESASPAARPSNNRQRDASGTLIEAIAASGQTRYAISQAAGVDQGTLSRMVNEGGWMGREAFDRLMDHLGLEIAPRIKGKRR